METGIKIIPTCKSYFCMSSIHVDSRKVRLLTTEKCIANAFCH